MLNQGLSSHLKYVLQRMCNKTKKSPHKSLFLYPKKNMCFIGLLGNIYY
jgi:hypothetical protein